MLLDVGPKTVSGISSSTALLVSGIVTHIVSGKSFSVPHILNNNVGHGVSSGLSHSVATLLGTGSISFKPSAFILGFSTATNAYMEYPKGSVLRTADELGKKLRQYIPNIRVISRMPTDVYKLGFPLIIVSPNSQHVHQVFTGYAGNPDGHPNMYSIRYLALPVTNKTNNMSVQQAQSQMWFYLELILRALKKEGLGTLNNTVVRVADLMDINYSEMGSYVTWRDDSFVGGIVKVSVFEQYRVYGM